MQFILNHKFLHFELSDNIFSADVQDNISKYGSNKESSQWLNNKSGIEDGSEEDKEQAHIQRPRKLQVISLYMGW